MTSQVGTRPEPGVSEHSRAFWEGGRGGRLLIARCAGCRAWLHPPQPLCPHCGSDRITAEAVSGRGTIYSYTVNRYQWAPGIEPPYVLAEVELAEDHRLRLLTAIVGSRDPVIGAAVRVEFEPAGEFWIPVFGYDD